MHRDLKELLHDAVGESRFAMVVFLHVRGFSSFAKLAESSETAIFLTTIYTKILDDFFPDASFFKPTGDGLLIVLDYDRDTLTDVVTKAVETSLRLVEAFPGLTIGEPMVNFDVPGELGVGLARGAATRLMSGDKTLDYSGRPLNLASRLMDIARPSGIVFDESLDISLLPEETANRFSAERVYVKGLAEDAPMLAYVLDDRVVVPDINRRPMNRLDHHVLHFNETKFKDLRQRTLPYRHQIDREPAEGSSVDIYVEHSLLVNGRRHPTRVASRSFPAEIKRQAGATYARINYAKDVVPHLEAQGVKDNWAVTLWVEYDCLPEG